MRSADLTDNPTTSHTAASTKGAMHTIGEDTTCPVCGGAATPLLQAPDRLNNRPELYSVVRCTQCTLGWLRNAPRPEQMTDHYGAEYHKMVRKSGEANVSRRWKSAVRRVHELSAGGALLDIGCSSGGFLESVKDGPWKLYGIEMSATEARRAEVRSNASVFIGDVLEANFPPESFDVITGFHVLEHFYQPKEVMLKIREWLKPGGAVYLHVPNLDALEARLFGSYWYPLDLPRHLYHFSPKSLTTLGHSVGFEDCKVHTRSEGYVEESSRYLFLDICSRWGLASRNPPAIAGDAPLGWRILRRSLRHAVLTPLRRLAVVADRGAAVEAVFRKSNERGWKSQDWAHAEHATANRR